MTRINIRFSNELEYFEYNNSINNRYINSNIFYLYIITQVAFEPVKHSNRRLLIFINYERYAFAKKMSKNYANIQHALFKLRSLKKKNQIFA